METTVDGDAAPAVRLEPRPFRGVRDGVIAAAFVVVVAACVTGAIVWGHAAFVLGAVYAAMAGVVWLEAFRSTWAIGPDELACRRWTRWRRFGVDDVRGASVDAGEPGVDVSVGGPRRTRVVVPIDDWRHRPGAVDELATFLTRAASSGADVDADVWRALGRRPSVR